MTAESTLSPAPADVTPPRQAQPPDRTPPPAARVRRRAWDEVPR